MLTLADVKSKRWYVYDTDDMTLEYTSLNGLKSIISGGVLVENAPLDILCRLTRSDSIKCSTWNKETTYYNAKFEYGDLGYLFRNRARMYNCENYIIRCLENGTCDVWFRGYCIKFTISDEYGYIDGTRVDIYPVWRLRYCGYMSAIDSVVIVTEKTCLVLDSKGNVYRYASISLQGNGLYIKPAKLCNKVDFRRMIVLN